eukprot:CAMPEP_0185597850 /NCGR_PEP_ID=MMETSP0434-20130131/81622_1 /TAXON_ID=626734 ORGANISM="Favella taraikaensis, Strain Fe Narragansett Bay" /NCGR_SAMPLE_ID=MMETSP0434 /ASSEMBLY_ACC=CAM_ASM_000379 /LENGTH=58 /DNA_ID=CAMNT_0028226677 /DNA_START=2112 /DNA_END=2288 /DNA_ORIENTATION=-
MENWKSATKKVIWKELMKQKEELSVSGDQRLNRQMIKTIRNKIRRERRKRMKKEGLVS